MKKAIVALAWIVMTCLFQWASAAVGTATQYKTVVEAIESGGDYTREQGTLVLLSDSTLHIQMSPEVVARDLPQVIEEMVQRAILEGFVVAFAQTSSSELSITAVPMEINLRLGTKGPTRLLTGYTRTVSVTRARFQELLNKYHIGPCHELIGTRRYDDIAVPNDLMEVTDRIMYNDAGFPGLNLFFGELANLPAGSEAKALPGSGSRSKGSAISSGTGVSCSQAMQMLDNYFDLSTGHPTATGQEKRLGSTSDNLAMIELIGDTTNLSELSLIAGIPKDDAAVANRNGHLILIFVCNAFPDWGDSADWVTTALRQVAQGKDVEITRGNKTLSMKFSPPLGMLIVHIEGR